MSQMIISFPEPQRIELVQGAELSLSFPAPGSIVLQVEGIQGPSGSGGGVSDGDKGGIVVSASGAVWTVKAGSITDLMLGASAIALFAAASHTHIIANVTGLQAALDGKQPLATVLTNTTASFTTAQETKLAGIASGATANATDASLRDRATHTGSQLAATISDFSAAVAATAAVTANTAKVTNATHTGDVTGSGALTIAALAVTSGKIADDAVGNDKLANMAFGTIKARVTAGSGNPENATGTEVTALLDTFTSGAKGLVPASGGGTTNFLRADGTFAAPGSGGSPGGSTGEVQFNNAGAFAGAADVEIETGQLRLPSIAIPAAPAAGGLKLFGENVAGRPMPAFRGPLGAEVVLQPHLGRGRFAWAQPPGNSTTAPQSVGITVSSTGTATAANNANTNIHTELTRLEYLVTVAATTAVVGTRGAATQWLLGSTTAGRGGFDYSHTWGPATGVATTTSRAFAGMRGSTAVPTDVEPSTLTNIVGMGWDAADTNIQFMHNDGAGAATKIDLGASFPVPTVDRTDAYRIEMYALPGTTQSLSYEITNLSTGAVATGTVTTNLPANTQYLAHYSYMSVGGTSSVIGLAFVILAIRSDN